MDQNTLKQHAAQAAIDWVLPKLNADDILGIGTGSTANFFIDMLDGHQRRFRAAVSSSEASSARLARLGIPVMDLNAVEKIAVYVDGADECNPELQLIKGGGGALTREKIVASCADEFVCIVDESKWVETLGRFPLPVEVIPLARESVARQLVALGGRPVQRKGFITDNGCEILDVYDLHIEQAAQLESQLNQIVGTVSNGLFAQRRADVVLLGTASGVRTLRP